MQFFFKKEWYIPERNGKQKYYLISVLAIWDEF